MKPIDIHDYRTHDVEQFEPFVASRWDWLIAWPMLLVYCIAAWGALIWCVGELLG